MIMDLSLLWFGHRLLIYLHLKTLIALIILNGPWHITLMMIWCYGWYRGDDSDSISHGISGRYSCYQNQRSSDNLKHLQTLGSREWGRCRWDALQELFCDWGNVWWGTFHRMSKWFSGGLVCEIMNLVAWNIVDWDFMVEKPD